MPKLSERLAGLPRVGSRVTSDLSNLARQHGIDMLSLQPYPVRVPPAHVVEAANAAALGNRETPSRGSRELRCAIADMVGGEIGRPVDPDAEVLITNGGMQALNLVFRSMLDAGDEVIVPAPSYYFEGCIALAGGRTQYVHMREDEHFRWDFAAIQAAITPRTSAIVVNTPVNPTGYVLSPADLEALVEIACRHDLFIVADESYDRLLFDGATHHTIACLPGAADRTILIKSFTKSYAMPAWRVGYIVAGAPYVDAFVKAAEWEQLHGNHVAQAAATAAVRGPQDWLASAAQEFEAARNLVLAELASVEGISCVVPSGGPFLFPNISSLFPSSQQASDALLAAGVPSVPGHYCQSDAHVRIALGASPEVLREAAGRIRQVAIEQLQTTKETR